MLDTAFGPVKDAMCSTSQINHISSIPNLSDDVGHPFSCHLVITKPSHPSVPTDGNSPNLPPDCWLFLRILTQAESTKPKSNIKVY